MTDSPNGTKVDALSDLIERLEKATGPDRFLDEWIARRAVGLVTEDKPNAWLDANLPRYTASIDAALTLVPEGWDWRVSGVDWDDQYSVRKFYFAYIREFHDVQRLPRESGKDAEGHAKHQTPALALCIAALKARHPNSKE